MKRRIETILDLKNAIAGIPNDMTFRFLFDGADYRVVELELCYPNEDGAFVNIEPFDE